MKNDLVISQKQIENRIINIRGVQVMLDSDLAQMFQSETKYINRAVKRNPDRFPIDFAFQIDEKEWENLNAQETLTKGDDSLRSHFATLEEDASRSQIVTLEKGRGKHRKFFTLFSTHDLFYHS